MQADSSTLQQVKQIGFGVLGDIPDCAGLNLDILGRFDAFEDGDRVAGNFEDTGELGERTVQFLLRVAGLFRTLRIAGDKVYAKKMKKVFAANKS